MKRFSSVLLMSLLPSLAWAGGFEIPDNNAEALGRGAAFTAKADDGSAIEYNIAGLARQRNTRTLLTANLVMHKYEFQRAGVYPDDPADPQTPYGGQPFPKIGNQGPVFFAPFFALSTDFGKFDRWTFAVGVFGPSSYGKREYPLMVGNLPGPGRYDLWKTDLLIVYPTLAVAVRVTKWLELGVALHLVVAHLQLANASIVDLGRFKCPNGEYQPCDSTSQLTLDGFTATAALGAMIHPSEAFTIGVNLRGPAQIDASGTVHGTPPSVMPLDIQDAPAEFHTKLPWVLRLGLRYAFLKDGFEHGDVEVDGTYEAWADAEGIGSTVKIPNLSIFQDINPVITHHYRDTFGVRVGGAYNIRAGTLGVLVLRLGFYFDSSSTHYADTRLDFDTMAKYAPTAGIGWKMTQATAPWLRKLKIKETGLNFSYAFVWSPDRDVSNGDIRVINAVTNGSNVSSAPDKSLEPVVNNGHYHAETQIFSISGTIVWDDSPGRLITYK